jgi:hypothetical protein
MVVPAGAHEVIMRYSNPLVTVCGIVSILTLGGTLIAARRRLPS